MISNETAVMDVEKDAEITSQKLLHARNLRYDALLVLITMIWGSTFLVVKYTVRLSGPFTYLCPAYREHQQILPRRGCDQPGDYPALANFNPELPYTTIRS